MKKQINITVPTDWSAVTLKQYLKLLQDLKTYGDTDEGYAAALLHNLCAFPPKYLYSLEAPVLAKIKNDIVNFMNKTDLPLQRFIMIDGKEYGFEPNLSNISYGAYLDISKWDTFQIDDNWAKIMSILYRQVIHKTSGLYEIKTYDGYIDDGKFLDVTMDIHFGALFFFCSFINGLTERYPELFEGDAGSSSPHQINFSRKWRNYSALIQLAGGDIRNIDEITDLPLEKCLLFLAYNSDLNQLQNLIQKEIMNKR